MEHVQNQLDELLSSLDDTTLRELQARLAYRFNRKRAPTVSEVQLESKYGYLYEDLLRATRQRGVGSVTAFLGRYGVQRFKSDADDLMAYVDRACGSKLSVLDRSAVIRVVLDCLVDEVRDWRNHGPITPDRILPLAGRWAPVAVERRFPGYADAGLLHRVVLMAVAA